MNYDHSSRIFARIGVRSWINAENWSTAIGGAYLDNEVVEAMRDAADVFCDMRELMHKAGTRVAELCGVEAVYITSGSAAGIVLAVASCITGSDTRKMARLYGGQESSEALANEIVIQAPHSSTYDDQYRVGGGKLIRVGYPYQVERHAVEDAISDKTVALAYVYSYHGPHKELSFSEMAEIAREHDLPLIVDCAAILPPKVNLRRFTDDGADLVIISGGKGIRGPGNTGLILGGGRHGANLIDAIRQQSFPNHGIGRPFKVSKEAIAGLLVALERFMAQDEEERYAAQLAVAQRIVSRLESVRFLNARVIPNDGVAFEHPVSAYVPRVCLEWDAATVGFDAAGLDERMAAGDPPIRLRSPRLTQANAVSSRSIRLIDTYSLREGDDRILIERLAEAFEE